LFSSTEIRSMYAFVLIYLTLILSGQEKVGELIRAVKKLLVHVGKYIPDSNMLNSRFLTFDWLKIFFAFLVHPCSIYDLGTK
jgi:hypothetical protein